MENYCDNALKIMKETYIKIDEYNNKISRTSAEKIEVDKIKTMNMDNYLKSVELYYKCCITDNVKMFTPR